MAKRTISIKFDAFGQINADAVGFTGTACEDATRRIMAGLADEVASDKKREYYQQANVEQSTGVGSLQLGSL